MLVVVTWCVVIVRLPFLALCSSCEQFLDQVLVRRDDAYKKFRKCLDLRIKYYFMMMLASRQFTGNMMFDHDKQSLEMVVRCLSLKLFSIFWWVMSCSSYQPDVSAG